MKELIPLIATGFGFGLLHSFDPDHLAAMSTLVGKERHAIATDFLKGASWGTGHTLSLAVFGAGLVIVGGHLTGGAERIFEAGVGVLLIYLGLRRLRDLRRGPHLHLHRHEGGEHAHVHLHPAGTHHNSRRAHARHSHAPLWIGILHGLAGTGGVMVLLPAVVISDLGHYLTYVLAFGAGSVLSMGAFCAGLGSAMSLAGEQFRGAGRWLGVGAGSASLAVGMFWLGTAAFA
jgi:hypothetical protein